MEDIDGTFAGSKVGEAVCDRVACGRGGRAGGIDERRPVREVRRQRG